MKNAVLVIVVLALVAGGVWFIKNSGSAAPTTEQTDVVSPSTTTPASDSAETKETMVNDNAKEVVIEASEFKFSPVTLTFKKGETVKLVLNNIGKMPHDFVVDELGVRTKKIVGGDSDTIEFTPEKTGVFEYYCSVGQHRQNGMVGKVTVE